MMQEDKVSFKKTLNENQTQYIARILTLLEAFLMLFKCVV